MAERAAAGVVGMVTTQLVVSTAEGGPAALVEDMVVAPDHRMRGTGRWLLRAAEAWARERGATRLQLLADRDNDAGAAVLRAHGLALHQPRLPAPGRLA